MQNELFTCDNGVTMQYTDMGVEYGYGGRTLQIVGEYEQGELSMSDSDEVVGYYERDDEGVTVVTLRDGVGSVITLNSEEDYEDFALMMLTAE